MRYNTQTFIEKCKKIHLDKFDYSEVEYISSVIPIKIICNKCKKSWMQEPRLHLSLKRSCPFCNKRKLTHDLFIERSKNKFGDQFDYTKTIYKNSRTKLILICKKCNSEIFTTSSLHLNTKGGGCTTCGNGKRTNKIFIDNANIIHNYKYEYLNVDYKNENSIIKIKCSEHGIFSQIASVHLNGSGCPKCVGKFRTFDDFIRDAIKVHGNKFDYSKSNFVNCSTKIKIICNRGHEFYQTPTSHLLGAGCKFCKNNCVSKKETKWLDSLNIPNINRNIKITIDGKCYIVDALIGNTIYEFYGNYWHGNPLIYKSTDYNKSNKKKFGELYESTLMREKIFIKNNFNVISIWENDFDKLKL